MSYKMRFYCFFFTCTENFHLLRFAGCSAKKSAAAYFKLCWKRHSRLLDTLITNVTPFAVEPFPLASGYARSLQLCLQGIRKRKKNKKTIIKRKCVKKFVCVTLYLFRSRRRQHSHLDLSLCIS